ncbi:MAG: hypothetical protein A2138_06030 [Deltaproteobacteria bacterium RBG_16_71_12]|nr:MAG: hypothetical protein A2138_06030 [Deltaproteobacteria bacterium RBG_16_71_12]
MTVVADASVVVAALVDGGAAGTWAEPLLARGVLAAPHLLPVEVGSALRRAARAGQISTDSASMAHEDLVALRIELFPYAPFAARIWELRDHVSPYDAWYVAVAETLGAQLATLDKRLARAHGLRCRVVTPPTYRGSPAR